MKTIFMKAMLLLLPFAPLHALIESDDAPEDQLLVICGSTLYSLYKVLDFANDHGFRYIKILSYEFTGFNHTMTGACRSDQNEGRFFELKDPYLSVSFLCFDEAPADPCIIDLEKYRKLLDDSDNFIEGLDVN